MLRKVKYLKDRDEEVSRDIDPPWSVIKLGAVFIRVAIASSEYTQFAYLTYA